MIAPETAAHAAGTSALLPMLALGIPGSPTAAVLLGGLLIWGLQPGPLLFVEQKDFVWGLIASMYLGNLVGLIVVLTTVPLFASILRIPFSIIAPVIIVICAIGAYTVHNAMLDIWFMLGFGVIGYVFKKLDYPLAPLVLALVLGDKAEDSFRQAMLVSQGEVSIMWANPLVGSITTLALLMLFWPLIVEADRPGARAQGGRARRAAAGGLSEGESHACHRTDPGNGLAGPGHRRTAGGRAEPGDAAARGGRTRGREDARLAQPDQPPARRQGGHDRAAAHRPPRDGAVHAPKRCSRPPPRATWSSAAGARRSCCARCRTCRASASCGPSTSACNG